jgi:pimeloyl-ACP methyl ester carboxylesterase
MTELIRARAPEGRAQLVGLSWGGRIAHTLLDCHPARIDRAVVDGATVRPSWLGNLVVRMVEAWLADEQLPAELVAERGGGDQLSQYVTTSRIQDCHRSPAGGLSRRPASTARRKARPQLSLGRSPNRSARKACRTATQRFEQREGDGVEAWWRLAPQPAQQTDCSKSFWALSKTAPTAARS